MKVDIVSNMKTLTRSWALDSQTITRADDGPAVFDGHAAVFNQPTLIGSREYGFVEEIMPDAFENVLMDDVRMLVNHEGLPLARTINGSLRLSQDEYGLRNVADFADTTDARDIAVLLERGDVTQQSFAFQLESGGSEWDEVEVEGRSMDRRRVTKVKRLFDVSIVTYPAYEGAIGGMRSMLCSDEEIAETLRELRDEATLIEQADEAARKNGRAESLLREHLTRGKVLSVSKSLKGDS